MAMEKAPAASPASPAIATAGVLAPLPTTPAISEALETSPSMTPNTAGRSQPPVTSLWLWCTSAACRETEVIGGSFQAGAALPAAARRRPCRFSTVTAMRRGRDHVTIA